MRGRQFGSGLGFDIRIGPKGNVAGHLGGGLFHLGRKAIADFEGFHLQTVHLVDDAIERVLQDRVAVDLDAAAQHEIDGVIEFRFGFQQPAFAVVRVAGSIRLVHAVNQALALRVQEANVAHGAGDHHNLAA